MSTQDAPYYNLVPKDFKKNLEFRREIIKWGSSSRENARELWCMCARDLPFYVNTFLFTYDPRLVERGETPVVPFITYPHQDEIMLEINDAIGICDFLGEKSRDVGMSYMILIVPEWRWHFREFPESYGYASRTEAMVDKTGSPKSLFWKVDFIHKHQPGWLLPNIGRNNLSIRNLDNDGTMEGEGTTGNLFRGDRLTCGIFDEFSHIGSEDTKILSASADVCNSRLFVGTPNGVGNEFYRLRCKPKMKIVSFHWSQHPKKARGLYIYRDGKVEIQDKSYVFPPGYKFPTNREGKKYPWGSPWYDNECERRGSRKEIAQELDIDYLGSGDNFFDVEELDRILGEDVREPDHTGELDFVQGTCEPTEFVEDGVTHHWELWFQLGIDGKPPKAEYVMAADIGMGTGNSNTSISVFNRHTGEQVAEYRSPHNMAHQVAPIAVAACKWFEAPDGTPAYLGWEANGEGRAFEKVVMNILNFTNVFFMRKETSVRKRRTLIPGWWSGRTEKVSLLSDYRGALARGSMTMHSADPIRQAYYYERQANGAVEHKGAVKSLDPAEARANHGDSLMAAAIAWHMMEDVANMEEPEEKELPPMCMQRRMDEYAALNRASSYW